MSQSATPEPGPSGLADLDPDGVPAGEPVIVKGTGPALADLLAPLTTGRGGRFVHGYDGEQVYLPGGREPLLYVGSERGVPHHSGFAHPFVGTEPPVPRFLTRETLGAGPWNFRRDVWPLVAKELAFAYYHELITAHPERVRSTWGEFEEAFAGEEWRSVAMRRMIRAAVPRHPDRLDLDRLDRPLHGIRFGDLPGMRKWMRGYLAADLERRSDPEHSADHAMVLALLSVRAVLAGAGVTDPWFREFSDHLAGGPPVSHLEDLRALAAAGVVTFLGADLRVDRYEGRWRAQTSTLPGEVTAAVLVDTGRLAWSPDRAPVPAAGPDPWTRTPRRRPVARNEARFSRILATTPVWGRHPT
ncbi:hypothetical protein ACLQ2R_11570 [Streptosporangium sp. DT93]|uniref:hypothetical protein n=1 Tax=Streptosporangium sp. DT93 TaxID=3393428 RepID=UPI003CEB104B